MTTILDEFTSLLSIYAVNCKNGHIPDPKYVKFRTAIMIMQHAGTWLTVTSSYTVNALATSLSNYSLDKLTFSNGTDVQQSNTISRTYQNVQTSTLTLSFGQKVGVSAKASFKIPFIGGTEITVSLNLDFSQTTTKTVTDTHSWTVNQPVQAAPHTNTTASVLLQEGTFNGAWLAEHTLQLTPLGIAELPKIIGDYGKKPLNELLPGFSLVMQSGGDISGTGGLQILVEVTSSPITSTASTSASATEATAGKATRKRS